MAWLRSGFTLLVAGVAFQPLTVSAQTPARDPSGVLEQVLPADVAQQVLQRIAEARSRGLPAAALENRALELHAKGLPDADIPTAVSHVADAMAKGKSALESGGRTEPTDGEIEAAGDASANGVDGSAISGLAKSAPSGRSLIVPITVLTSLMNRGLPSDEPLAKVVAKLQARATDQQLRNLPDQAAGGLSHKPASPGSQRPTSIPVNGGQGTRPTSVPAPSTPGHGRP
jgi:hypothetical protein